MPVICDIIIAALTTVFTEQVLFMHGGAHAQFSGVPLNLLGGRTKADYLDVGYWSVRAAAHAEAYCQIGTPAVCRGNVPPTDTVRSTQLTIAPLN